MCVGNQILEVPCPRATSISEILISLVYPHCMFLYDFWFCTCLINSFKWFICFYTLFKLSKFKIKILQNRNSMVIARLIKFSVVLSLPIFFDLLFGCLSEQWIAVHWYNAGKWVKKTIRIYYAVEVKYLFETHKWIIFCIFTACISHIKWK